MISIERAAECGAGCWDARDAAKNAPSTGASVIAGIYAPVTSSAMAVKGIEPEAACQPLARNTRMPASMAARTPVAPVERADDEQHDERRDQQRKHDRIRRECRIGAHPSSPACLKPLRSLRPPSRTRPFSPCAAKFEAMLLPRARGECKSFDGLHGKRVCACEKCPFAGIFYGFFRAATKGRYPAKRPDPHSDSRQLTRRWQGKRIGPKTVAHFPGKFDARPTNESIRLPS
jgi:hypothetical protein